MDALLWYGLGIAILGILGAADRWADSVLRNPSANPGKIRFALLVRKFALGAFYLAFALGVATALYALGSLRMPTACTGPGCPF
jgi:hypothetical protein